MKLQVFTIMAMIFVISYSVYELKGWWVGDALTANALLMCAVCIFSIISKIDD
jgi:hypothetical protein